ncbi:hypothetical protein BC332_16168 [Capsicum chinense]|nr:hypothetical protein BC332_16168 [Capsicum chinense]
MADGFLNLQNELEGEAEKCLQDLIDRCLVLFSEKSLDETKISTCYVHDLIYDLFLREVQRENIFTTNDSVFDNSDANHDRSKCQSLSRHKLHPFKSFTGDEIHDFPYGFYSTRQLRDHGNNDPLKRTHSIRISGGYFSTLILKSVLIHFKLLKLLNLSHMRIVSFPLHIVSLIWLRYLELHCGKNFDIPPEICRLWNLQTFIVEGNCQTDMQTFIVERIRRSVINFPKEIWGLMQLRHLKVDRFILPNPPSVSVDRVRHLDFSNIQTISYLSPHCCTKEVISEIQNVKKLGIYGNQDDYKSFQKSGPIIPSAKSFPATLKKLKLKSTYLSWLYLDIIAELPNLEVLELVDYACCGKEWHPIVRGFTRLKLLLIEENDLSRLLTFSILFSISSIGKSILVQGQNKRARQKFRHSLQQVAADIDRVWKELTKIQDKGKQASKESLVQDFSSSANDTLNVKSDMVGRDDQRKQLLELMTIGYSGEHKVIPMIGMGGIGKTTLAKEIYNDVCIRCHFDVRAWATVSQQHNVKEILVNLLHSTKGDTFDMVDKAKIEDMLQKSLKSKRTIEDWESVAKDVKSFVTNDPDERCSYVLGLSYNNLTSNLKSCLLYFGIFREDTEIPVKNLMRLWMAEGFLNLENDLEGEAMKCLQDLIDRCLVLVGKKSLDETKIRSYLIHFKLLKVLDLRPIEMDRFPLEILSLIWLRYLAFSYPRNFDIPSEIYKLWNLQTFIVNGYARSDVTFPEKIWGLIQLRHLEMDTFRLPNRPRGSVDKGRHWDFPNIQTISCLSPSCCTKEVISGIQNIKKPGIRGDKVDYESLRESGLLNNLVHLQQLETLSLQLYFRKLSVISSAKVFPETLKKLKLYGTNLSWSYLDIISELPNLEVLKLMPNACYGGEWYPIVRGFNRLKLLLVKNSDLQFCKATNDNFPVRAPHAYSLPFTF